MASKERIDVVLPTLNYEKTIEGSCLRLLKRLRRDFGNNFVITIADNGSTDRTFELARKLSEKYPEIRAFRLDRKGKGLAVKKAWMDSDCEYLAFIDADLAYDPAALKKVRELLKDNDLVSGSRNLAGSKSERFLYRKALSASYTWLAKFMFRSKLTDFASGLKGIRKGYARKILPKVKDDGLFFDTELLLRAEKKGARIAEIPVSYIDHNRSTFKAGRIAPSFLLKLVKLRLSI